MSAADYLADWPDTADVADTPLGAWLRTHATPFDIDLVKVPAHLTATGRTAL